MIDMENLVPLYEGFVPTVSWDFTNDLQGWADGGANTVEHDPKGFLKTTITRLIGSKYIINREVLTDLPPLLRMVIASPNDATLIGEVAYRRADTNSNESVFFEGVKLSEGYQEIFVELPEVVGGTLMFFVYVGERDTGIIGNELHFKTIELGSVPVEGVLVEPGEFSGRPNDTKLLTANVIPANASFRNVEWESGNNNVAVVDQSGFVTLVDGGRTTITASVDGLFYSSCQVETIIDAEKLNLNPSYLTIRVGSDEAITPAFTPDNTTDKTLSWSSGDESIAKVLDGVVTGVSIGRVEVTAETHNGVIAKAVVNVIRGEIFPTKVMVSPRTMTMTAGEVGLIEAEVLPSDADNKVLQWFSSNDLVATIDQGRVVSVSAGSVLITAKASNGVMGVCAVTVKPAPRTVKPLLIETLMSQYANSPNIVNLLNEMAYSIDPSSDLEAFYNIAWNASTAKGFGLDIWGRIVGINRNMRFVDPKGDYFGFEESKHFKPFNQAPFSGAGGKFSSYELPDEQFRTLIMIKAMSNIVYATAPNINKLLKFIFKGRAYFLITGHMKARYFFEFTLSAFERAVVYDLGILPRPCGVLLDYRELDIKQCFGFAGTGLQPFNQGVFA